MEDIAQGQRVREWVIEGRVPTGGWETLGKGQSIGHKRILNFPSQQLAGIRLRVTKFVASPKLAPLAAFNSVA